MDADLDEQLLFIIKSDCNENGDESDAIKDVLEMQPVCVVEENASCGELVTAEDAEHDGHEATDDDPLGEETVPTDALNLQKDVLNQFNWLFDDNDLLQDECNLIQNIIPTSGKRAKRARILSEQKRSSRNGEVWTVTSTAENKLLHVPEFQAIGKGPASNVSNVLQPFLLLFDEPLLKEILIYTNEEIRKRRHAKKTATSGTIDIYEMRAWLGLNYLCGVFRNAIKNGPLDELWTPELGNAIFRATMPYTRFVFIAEHLSLAESPNNLELIRKVWNRFNINCRSYYSPSSWCAVDEHFLCTHSQPKSNRRCSQPDEKYLNLITLCDAKTLYLMKADIISDEYKPENVYQLVCDIKTTKRNIALNERYANLNLAKNLLKRTLSSTGRLVKTSTDLPIDCNTNNINEITLYLDAAKITSCNEGFLLSCGLSSKLDAAKVHESGMQANTLLRDLSSAYDTSKATPPALEPQNSLSLKFLHTILNFAAFNAWILFRLSPKGSANIEQRDYIRQLGLFMTQQRLERLLPRASATPLLQKLNICEILGVPMTNILAEAACKAQESTRIGVLHLDHLKLPIGITLSSRHAEKSKRCRSCTKMKRQSKSRIRCQQCLAVRCHNHLIARCFECTGITPEQAQSISTNNEYNKID